MAYIATSEQRDYFLGLHAELRNIIYSYQQQKGIKLFSDGGITDCVAEASECPDFNVIKKSGPFTKTVLTISPPYATEHVTVKDPKCYDLAAQLKSEIAKFWAFGILYNYEKDNEEIYSTGQINGIIFSRFFKGKPRKSPRNERKLAVKKVLRQRLECIIESKN